MGLDFLDSATNAILVGASGLGKTMIARGLTVPEDVVRYDAREVAALADAGR